MPAPRNARMTEKPPERQAPAFGLDLFLWPLRAASEAAAAQAGGFAQLMAATYGTPARSDKPAWTTPNRVRLDLSTMELRDFSTSADGVPTLVCAPFALHSATLADFAPGHSLVQTLTGHGCARVFVSDWRSATREMRLLTIDSYLAELNVAVDEIGAPVDLVGLCQGGVMALIYAARFPEKVRKLVLAGAPIDVEAETSLLALTAQHLPVALFDEVVRLGDGRVLGQRIIDLWRPALNGTDSDATLQHDCSNAGRAAELRQRFRDWLEWTVDLPGAYYHQTVLWLFKENRLATGRLTALGQRIDLGAVRQPTFLLAARDDELVAVEQLMATRRLLGTPADRIESAVEPCSHLALFIGARSLAGSWTKIASWLRQSSST
jgi:poly(3-hydroxyalkanoate) synthetase